MRTYQLSWALLCSASSPIPSLQCCLRKPPYLAATASVVHFWSSRLASLYLVLTCPHTGSAAEAGPSSITSLAGAWYTRHSPAAKKVIQIYLLQLCEPQILWSCCYAHCSCTSKELEPSLRWDALGLAQSRLRGSGTRNALHIVSIAASEAHLALVASLVAASAYCCIRARSLLYRQYAGQVSLGIIIIIVCSVVYCAVCCAVLVFFSRPRKPSEQILASCLLKFAHSGFPSILLSLWDTKQSVILPQNIFITMIG